MYVYRHVQDSSGTLYFCNQLFTGERFSLVPCNSLQFQPIPSLNSSKCLKIFHKRHIKAGNSVKDICRHVVNTCRFFQKIYFPKVCLVIFMSYQNPTLDHIAISIEVPGQLTLSQSRDPAKEIEFEVSAINVVTYVIAWAGRNQLCT